MARSVRAELSTIDWVGLTDAQLRSRGADPKHRVCYTGHQAFVREQYLPSIGAWGGLESSEMVSVSAPHLAMLHVSPSAFRQFKARYRLMTRGQFERHHGPQPWVRAELSFNEHSRAQRAFGLANGVTRGDAAPIGSACTYAAATARVNIGLLPVEIVLWSALFGVFLGHHVIGADEWNGFPDDEKLAIWELGRDGESWDISVSARDPAVLHVRDWTLALAAE